MKWSDFSFFSIFFGKSTYLTNNVTLEGIDEKKGFIKEENDNVIYEVIDNPVLSLNLDHPCFKYMQRYEKIDVAKEIAESNNLEILANEGDGLFSLDGNNYVVPDNHFVMGGQISKIFDMFDNYSRINWDDLKIFENDFYVLKENKI
jgi:hypothetical protein